MTFEQHPIVLILFVVLIIEGWNLTKLAIRTMLEGEGRRPRRPDEQ